jgi:hypothetical protein
MSAKAKTAASATTPKVTVDLTPGRCTCGCGEPTKGKSLWRPGHDQRAKGQLKRAHLAGQRVTVVEGKARRQLPAVEAAARLDTDRYSWSGALTPPPADEATEDATEGQEDTTEEAK